MIRVQVVDGVVVNIEGNAELPDFEELTPGQGRVCPKPYGLIQKLYNPYRLKNPVKRTNPEKGRGIDPGWVEISWDEALDLVAEKLKQVRASDSRKLSVDDIGPQKRLTLRDFGAFTRAFGPTQTLMSGTSGKCDAVEHIFCNIIHGGFQCEPDLPLCNYLLWMGGNESASGGAPQNVLYSDARARGMKAVVIDPVLTITAAKAQEWIPIRPGTDTAFLLALIQVIINERGIYDIPFLKEMTNSPYLVGPDGYFVRDKETKKVLMWDTSENKAKTFDDETIKDVALEGSYTVDGVTCRPSFQVLKEHVSQFTPEWGEKVTDIPAATIRRIAQEFIENARIGQTITLDGITFPYRPVSTKTGRGVSGVPRGYSRVLAWHILVALAGALEVPGGHCGGSTLYTRPYFWGKTPGPDGMSKIDAHGFTWPPVSLDGAETLLPYSKIWGKLNHLDYLNLVQAPENFPLPALPEVYINFRSNPMLGLGEPEIIEKALKKIPFIVSINYSLSELTELADVVLPEHSDLERYELLCHYIKPAMAKKFSGIFLTQPAVRPIHNTKDLHYIVTELADRIGILGEYNKSLNEVLQLKTPFTLEPDRKSSMEEVVELQCRSATDGAHDLAWFKEHGAIIVPVPAEDQYAIHLKMKAEGLRYPIPYMEHVKKTGEELAKNLADVGVNWWPTTEYTALPEYQPSVVEELPAEYDFYVTTCRVPQFSYGSNVDIPWFNEMAQLMHMQEDIMMNEDTAMVKGICDGDEVWVESPVGKIKGRVQLIKGIRPDTILIPGQFGQWAT
ncbi:molybdopterin-dependent oxidoreductase, partial [Chloroflexota bacterium]